MTKKKRDAKGHWTPVGHESVQADARLGARQAHGFSASQANHFKDVISGRAAKPVRSNNAKDGPEGVVRAEALLDCDQGARASSRASFWPRRGRRCRWNPAGSTSWPTCPLPR